MKERELRDVAVCNICGQRFGGTGAPLFYRVRVQRYALDLDACNRQNALGMMLNGPLAMAMGPDEDLANKIWDFEITVCEQCSTKESHLVAELVEYSDKEVDSW